MTMPVTRRRALGLSLGAGLGAALGGLGRPLPALADTDRHHDGDPVSMAMHIHASFSEGRGSMQAHLSEAERLGIDMVWWTEHDFRLTAHGYRRAVRFEGLSEPEDDVDWTWQPSTDGAVQGAQGQFVDDPHSQDEPGRALRLQACGPATDWGVLTYEGHAWNSTYTTSFADTTLELDVLAESLGPDAELVVEVESSYRPATGGRPAGGYTVQYRVGTGGPRTTERNGLLGVVPVSAQRGWQRLRLRPVDDVAALWPDLVAADGVLFRLRLAVRARRGATASAVVDRLHFRRDRRDSGDAALALQREIMRAYETRFPSVRQAQASELSLVRHLNMFGGTGALPDYRPGPVKDDSLDAAAAMVGWAHRQGALVSWNHPLNQFGRDAGALGRALVSTRALGADAVEVGCPQDVEALAAAYDTAASAGVFVTATGVTDNHNGHAWDRARARWVTSAWARSTQDADLLGAVGAGRAWFWDVAGWRGELDLSVSGRPAMGGVLVAGRETVPVEVLATELPGDGSLEVVVGSVSTGDTAAPGPQVRRVPAAQARHGGPVLLSPDSWLRVAVRDGSGALVGFSNPVWVLADEPARGVPAARRLPGV